MPSSQKASGEQSFANEEYACRGVAQRDVHGNGGRGHPCQRAPRPLHQLHCCQASHAPNLSAQGALASPAWPCVDCDCIFAQTPTRSTAGITQDYNVSLASYRTHFACTDSMPCTNRFHGLRGARLAGHGEVVAGGALCADRLSGALAGRDARTPDRLPARHSSHCSQRPHSIHAPWGAPRAGSHPSPEPCVQGSMSAATWQRISKRRVFWVTRSNTGLALATVYVCHRCTTTVLLLPGALTECLLRRAGPCQAQALLACQIWRPPLHLAAPWAVSCGQLAGRGTACALRRGSRRSARGSPPAPQTAPLPTRPAPRRLAQPGLPGAAAAFMLEVRCESIHMNKVFPLSISDIQDDEPGQHSRHSSACACRNETRLGSACTFCTGDASSPAAVRRLSGLGDEPTRFMDLAGNKASFGVEMSTPFRCPQPHLPSRNYL